MIHETGGLEWRQTVVRCGVSSGNFGIASSKGKGFTVNIDAKRVVFFKVNPKNLAPLEDTSSIDVVFINLAWDCFLTEVSLG